MSQQVLIVKCKDCLERYAKSSKDKNNPFFGDDAEFGIVLEWLPKNEALKKMNEAKCPNCQSENWYFTDASEH